MACRRWLLVLGALLPAPALAHSFGRLYNLPVPFWLYAWAAAAALLVSFLVVGYFLTAPAGARAIATRDASAAPWLERLRRARVLPILQGLSVALLLLCIVAGFFGNPDPYRNFSMTFFWVIFVLLFTYVTAFIGDLYAAINPWRVLAEAAGRRLRGFTRGRFAYPAALGDWPALVLYMAFIWQELFGYGRPASLATLLLIYTLINAVGVWLVGATAWFRHCEFFAVFLRLVALMAPLDYQPAAAAGERGTLRWRLPFAGLVQERPERLSTVTFALFMLSSTAFDGLRATQTWFLLFWKDPTGIVTDFAGKAPVMAYAMLRPWYTAWESLWLLASPFLYLAAYLLCIALAKRAARSERPLRELALDFGYTLLPIALVYHVTHYATLILTQGVKIVSLLSDPFGWGWNLFGTASLFRRPFLPDLGVVWHTQVGLILFGHIVSVYVAHLVALRVFPTRQVAMRSQLPMLALMVAFTVIGLWILAQPLTAMTLN